MRLSSAAGAGERWAPTVFIMPAVLIVLASTIFPLIVSLRLSLSRFKLAKGGFTIDFIGTAIKKLLVGSQQFHLLGKLVPPVAAGLAVRRGGGGARTLAGRNRRPPGRAGRYGRRAVGDRHRLGGSGPAVRLDRQRRRSAWLAGRHADLRLRRPPFST